MSASLSPSLIASGAAKFVTKQECHTAFVYSSWLQTFRYSGYARAIKKNVYFNYQSAVIQSILERCKIMCLVDPKQEENLIAWAAFEDLGEDGPWVMHYLVVKPSYQKLGIANEIIRSIKPKGRLCYFSHKNDNREQPWLKTWLEEKHQLIYNPYLARSIESWS